MKAEWGLHYLPSQMTVKADTNPRSWRASSDLSGKRLLKPDIFDPFKDYENNYLLPNWDGYGALPITRETIDTARSIYNFLSPHLRTLSAPHIAPGPDGTIGFEWRFSTGEYSKLLIEAHPRRMLHWYAVRRADNHFEDQAPITLERGKDSLKPLLHRLASKD